MSTSIILLGSGGHAEVLLALTQSIGIRVDGITSADNSQQSLLGVPILGDDRCLQDYAPQTTRLINGIGSAGAISLRAQIYQRYQQQGYEFLSLQHPQASLDNSVTLGKGNQIMHGATLIHGASLGENVLVNSRTLIEHHCQIGAHCHIASGAVLCGHCQLENNVHVGAGATVIQSIKIGAGAVVAAGAVVTKDVPAGCMVAGIPAQIKIKAG